MLVSARDIMTEHIVAIDPGTTVQEAVGLMLRHAVSALPVVNRDRKLLGLISEYDLLKNLVDGRPTGRPVSDYMMRAVRTVSPVDNVAIVAERFLTERHRRYPVVDHGRLVGLVSRRDVLRIMESARSTDDDFSATNADPEVV
jgi:CBS domain-containing protein